MSLTLLNRVRGLLDDNNLLDGYAVRYFRWTDADIAGNTPLILFRQTGSGESNELVQNTTVSIVLLATPTTVVTADARMQTILRTIRLSGSETGSVRFDPSGTVVGPSYLENGRPVFSLDVVVFTQDQ